jgi:hypothetical protein
VIEAYFKCRTPIVDFRIKATMETKIQFVFELVHAGAALGVVSRMQYEEMFVPRDAHVHGVKARCLEIDASGKQCSGTRPRVIGCIGKRRLDQLPA